MGLDEGDEVLRGVAGESRFCEVRIVREEVSGCAVEIGEVAAAAAGDEDLFADAFRVVEQFDALAGARGFDGAEEASGAGAEDDGVAGLWWRGLHCYQYRKML